MAFEGQFQHRASYAIFICSSCPQTALWCVSAGAERFNGKVESVGRRHAGAIAVIPSREARISNFPDAQLRI
jgi:hypothetical protein